MKSEMVLGRSQQGILKTRMAIDQQRVETFVIKGEHHLWVI